MSNANINSNSKEILLIVRTPQGAWEPVLEEQINSGPSRPREFRTESAAQREGSLMLKEGKIDAYKVYKLMSLHH